jgi:hypothetical protein
MSNLNPSTLTVNCVIKERIRFILHNEGEITTIVAKEADATTLISENYVLVFK